MKFVHFADCFFEAATNRQQSDEGFDFAIKRVNLRGQTDAYLIGYFSDLPNCTADYRFKSSPVSCYHADRAIVVI